ncbi:MAG TPA: SurA N-terminal domain-containing protein [Pseudolabrys sp.]|nr:SurA N-terminal domain-containing protein [Pseudolabrys sp.]
MTRQIISLPFCFGATMLLAVGIGAPARAQVVVVANGSPITVYDIEQRSKLIANSTHKVPSRQEVIQDLIDDRIKIDKAKSYGVVASDDEVNQAFNSMATRQHITPDQLGQFLQHAGIATDTLKARIRAELVWGQLVRGKFSSSLQVAEPDIAYAMRERKESDSVGYIYTLYPVIVVVPYGSPAPILEAKRKEAENLRSRFNNCKTGLEFARGIRDIAVREPVTRSTADLPQQLRDLLNGMQIGQLTPPEATAQGLQMFAVCDKKASKTESPVQRELKEEIFQRRFKREAEHYLEELRKQAMIEYKDESYAKNSKPEKASRAKSPR